MKKWLPGYVGFCIASYMRMQFIFIFSLVLKIGYPGIHYNITIEYKTTYGGYPYFNRVSTAYPGYPIDVHPIKISHLIHFIFKSKVICIHCLKFKGLIMQALKSKVQSFFTFFFKVFGAGPSGY